MPYTYVNKKLLRRFANARAIKLTDWYDISAALDKVDFSVVASRRDGHTALTSAIGRAGMGVTLFDTARRFSDTLDAAYLSMSDPETADILAALTSSLSYRSTTEAKDTQAAQTQTAANSGQQKSTTTVIMSDQGNQDNFKRFEELKKRFAMLPTEERLIWCQETFESTVATWTV